MKPSIAWAIQRGLPVFPVLEVWWQTQGTVVDHAIYAAGGIVYPEGFARPLVSKPGFGVCSHGARVDNYGTIESSRTSVILDDPNMEIVSFLERYFPKDSAANVWWASPSLLQSDWESLYTGLIDGWRTHGPKLELMIGPDDGDLRAEAPKPLVERPVFSAAPDPSVYGMTVPYVLGIHDAYQITGRGMVPCIPVKYNEDLGFQWLVTGGQATAIRRVYFDGILQDSSIWTTVRGVYGSVEMTLLEVTLGAQPEKDAIVSVDVEGPDVTGSIGGASNVNPVRQLRILLENYVLGNLRVGPYATSAHPKIHAASWNAVEQVFTDHDWDSGAEIGGHRETLTGKGLMESFLKSYPYVRAWWTEEGQIALMLVETTDQDPPAVWTNLNKLRHVDIQHDTLSSDVVSDVNMAYMYSVQEQKHLASYVSQDVGLAEWLAVPQIELLENYWSQARFTRD